VLHSDIKSSNVLVANGQPKLIDFGIARSLATDGDATQTLSRHFSPANVTPEQLRGERLGVACDVYQLGALLHELLCGQRVHTAASANLESLRKAVIDEVPPAPSQRVVDVHPDVLATRGLGHADALASELKGDLDAIVGRCLRKPAGERYRSVEALESDLRAYLTLQPVQARGGESWYRFRRFLARNRLPVALGALAASAVLALVAMGAFHVLRINAALAQAAAERDVAEQVTEFMIEAFRSADPNHSLQPETSVGEVLTRAGQLLATRDLATEPKVRMLRALAQAQFGVSDFLTAVKTLESADELYSQVARGSSARVQAEIAAQRARVLQELGRCEEALVHAGRAIDLFRSNGNGLDIQLGTRHVVIVCNRQVLGWETALAQTKALLVEMETASDLPLRERAAFEITAVKYLRDEEGTRAEGVPLGRALALIDGSIERLEAAGPEFRVEAILARLQRADLLEANHGRFEEAEAQIRQVITDIREVLGERTPSLGLAYNALGNVLKAEDRLDEAVEAYRKSLEVYDGSYQTPHASQVAPLINIGFVHQIQERNDLALEAFEAARARALRDPENLGSILEFATSILAELMQAEGRWQESVDMLLQMPDEPTNGLRIKIRRQFGLIRAYLELGDRPAARQAFSVVEPLFVSGEVKDRKLLEDVEGFRALLLELPQEQSQTERGGG
jgi:tetratricopeptide (TPR) repeat protein